MENLEADKRSMKSQIEVLASAAGCLALLFYALGFLILSLHEATFGISQFNPLRTKIVAAGFLTACLAALPVAALHYGVSYLTVGEPKGTPCNDSIEKYREVVALLGFIYMAWLMAAFSGFLFVHPISSEHRSWVYYVFPAIVVVFFGFSYTAIGERLLQRPRSCLLLATLVAVLLLMTMDLYSGQTSTALAMWYFSAGVAAFMIRASKDRIRFALDWRNWLWSAFVVWFYVTTIYSKIQPKYGGGAPAPIVLYLDNPTAWMHSRQVSALLLDETDDGYYILLPNKDRALFIARSDVAALYFGAIDEPQKK